MVLEWKISNPKLSWEEEVKIFLKLRAQLSIVKFAIYYWQKKYSSFVRPSKLLFLNFLYFWGLDILKIFIF